MYMISLGVKKIRLTCSEYKDPRYPEKNRKGNGKAITVSDLKLYHQVITIKKHGMGPNGHVGQFTE